MSKQELREYMVETYFTLRITIAASAILLPLVLLAWATIDDRVDMQGSISAFYYTSARNAFVGIVIAMGIALIAYHGYDAEEDWALNVAGVLAVLVALFPAKDPNSSELNAVGIVHGVSAISFFAILAFSINRYAGKTLRLSRGNIGDKEKKALEGIYKWFFPTAIALLVIFSVGILLGTGPGWWLFAAESAALFLLSAFWGIKTYELSKSNLDEKIVSDEPPPVGLL